MSVRRGKPDTNAPSAGPFILAIGSQNDFAHRYPNEQALLADHDIGAGVEERPVGLEFFDSEGRRLAAVHNEKWELLRLVPTAESADREAVERRLDRVLQHMRSFIQQRPDVINLYGMTEEEALALFEPSDEQGLASVFSAGDSEDGRITLGAFGEYDDQGIVHNLVHHGHF